MMNLKHSKPIFPSPIFSCLSSLDPHSTLLSFKCIPDKYFNPTILSKSFNTLSNFFDVDISYPEANR